MARQVYLHGRPLVRCTFFGSFNFPKKKRSDHESQKSGFRFDLKNPLEVWIFWIHDPFWILVIKRKIRFWIQESGFAFSPKNASLSVTNRAQNGGISFPE